MLQSLLNVSEIVRRRVSSSCEKGVVETSPSICRGDSRRIGLVALLGHRRVWFGLGVL